jgi:hypothetical protein
VPGRQQRPRPDVDQSDGAAPRRQLRIRRVYAQPRQHAAQAQPSFSLHKHPMMRIRIRQIRMLLGLLDPDPNPLVKGPDLVQDPDTSIIKHK